MQETGLFSLWKPPLALPLELFVNRKWPVQGKVAALCCGERVALDEWGRARSSPSAGVPDGARCSRLVLLCKRMSEHLFAAERLRICAADGHERPHESQWSWTGADPDTLRRPGMCAHHTADVLAVGTPPLMAAVNHVHNSGWKGLPLFSLVEVLETLGYGIYMG
ncbi:hypothetical protein AAFF_G00284460 [Aldrovandia affinis]|uniref:Uncharacterized protein n=1 Tax=Aldrovandia affinis TaxID=143900 RepID=A0AAD7TA71_9TELE|nr:hypothetical protein AAFF_G00284460 [Aldrovandia affinis]